MFCIAVYNSSSSTTSSTRCAGLSSLPVFIILVCTDFIINKDSDCFK